MIEFYKRYFYGFSEVMGAGLMLPSILLVSALLFFTTLILPILYSFWFWEVFFDWTLARIAFTGLMGLLASSYKYGVDK